MLGIPEKFQGDQNVAIYNGSARLRYFVMNPEDGDEIVENGCTQYPIMVVEGINEESAREVFEIMRGLIGLGITLTAERVFEALNHEAEKRIHKPIFVKSEFLELMKDGSKTQELRIAYFGRFRKIWIGDVVKFSSSSESIEVKITNVRPYKTLDDVIKENGVDKIAPTIPDAERRIRQFFDPDMVEEFGLLLFDFELV